jgi:hypothetical protein
MAQTHLLVECQTRFEALDLAGPTAATMEWDDCFTPKTKGYLKVLIKELND